MSGESAVEAGLLAWDCTECGMPADHLIKPVCAGSTATDVEAACYRHVRSVKSMVRAKFAGCAVTVEALDDE